MRAPARVLLAVLLAALVAGCGFQLRGAAKLPFDTIFLPGATGGIALDLKRNLQASTNTRVVDTARDAQAVLEFTQELRQKDILSLTGSGRVREFQLRYIVGYRVHDGKGREFVAPGTVTLQREVSFNDSAVLAKENEEALLWQDMQNDMVQQIMRRVAAARAPG